ncbi:Isopenicillin N synthase [Cinnamomum micranthum f. kanehirae]|uniref:gibberellin 2beta-dioxygenase n=1 Tax=Cinnamomum micranthum f. kanehirae TaxID=337451 RepID=A0A443PUU6_9MAGN|nr:Isopenicillin N synthase [Cinnamomum micranthum f. kanehirae]
MVVASPTPVGCDKIQSIGVPVIDFSWKKGQVMEAVVRACEEYGFFKLINHGVPKDVIRRMEEEGHHFFGRPASEKQRAGPPDPLGYGNKNIGFNGDMGEIEYLLLPTNPLSIAQRSKAICRDPVSFCLVVNGYIEAVRGLACEILDLLSEGLRIKDKRTLSRLIKASDNDSMFRINHYPSCEDKGSDSDVSTQCRIGFGEHSDPMMLTILRSNDAGGLQISVEDGVWLPIPPDPSAFYVNVGDALQALTNGRFLSVRHRAMAHSIKPRMSTIYFAAPPLHAWISPLPEMVTPQNPSRYRPFTWAEYKRTTYSLRLGESRLNLFKTLT